MNLFLTLLLVGYVEHIVPAAPPIEVDQIEIWIDHDWLRLKNDRTKHEMIYRYGDPITSAQEAEFRVSTAKHVLKPR